MMTSTNILYESDVTVIEKFFDEKENQFFIRKILKDEYPTRDRLIQFANEFEITKELQVEGIRRSFRREKSELREAIVLEFVEGVTIHKLEDSQRNLKTVLNIFIQISEALSQLHARNIIHKDLNPANIIFNAATQKVTLIDFGFSSRFELQSTQTVIPQMLEGTLAYISPEQTGRMNRRVDYRSDLYSVGVLLFQLLAGELPFSTKDSIKLIHSHIASKPPVLHQLRSEIPEALSNIVNKLLEKNAEGRYQSASGLKHDLSVCLEQLEATGKIENFELGQQDYSGFFQLPKKLYGRQKEIRLLVNAAGRTAKAGHSEFLLLKGISGVGKSALVHELHQHLTLQRVIFLEGKYDQLQRDIPYFGIIQVLQGLTNFLLVQNEKTLAKWRTEILDSMKGILGVLTSLVPDLELVVGKPLKVAALEGMEAENRLLYVFRQFFNIVATKEHPLVLFIDDLQWADYASIKLLEELLSDLQIGHFLLIGAYRGEEVDDTHPLMKMKKSLEKIVQKSGKQGLSISEIELKNISQQDIYEIVSDTLNCDLEYGKPLAEIIFNKSKGNPIFIRQLLETMYDHKVLHFDRSDLKWKWDNIRMGELELSDNIVKLIASRIENLPENYRQILRLASCIGNRFQLRTLMEVSGKSKQELVEIMPELTKEDIVQPLDDHFRDLVIHTDLDWDGEVEFRFTHDRLQRAAYTTIPKERLEKWHYRIGRFLQQELDNSESSQLFETVYHLNAGAALLENETEKIQLAQLNLQASQKAKRSAAFQPSLNYAQNGLDLLPENMWKTHYDLALGLNTNLCEMAYLTGDYEKMDAHFESVIQNSQQIIHEVPVYYATLQSEIVRNKFEDAIKRGLFVLRKLGINFPKNPKSPNIIGSLLRTKAVIGRKKIESLEHLPEMTDENMKAAMLMMKNLIPAAFRLGTNLFPLLVFKMVRISLKHGNTHASAFGYASYAISLCGVVGDLDGGYAFGKMAGRVEKKTGDNIAFLFNNFVRHWKEPLHLSGEGMGEAYLEALSLGDQFTAVWSSFYQFPWRMFSGEFLEKLKEEMLPFYEGYWRTEMPAFHMGSLLIQVVDNLLNKKEAPTILKGDWCDEEKMVAVLLQGKDGTGLLFFNLMKAWLNFIFGKYEKAEEYNQEASKYLEAGTAMPFVALFHFYHALNLLAAGEGNLDSKNARVVKGAIKNFKKWTSHCPENNLHRQLLLQAELALRTGKHELARDKFKLAITAAEESGFVQEEALIHERVGRFYFFKKEMIYAEVHLLKAVKVWKKWGANAKVNVLLNEFAEFDLTEEKAHLQVAVQSVRSGSGSTKVSSLVDLPSILKATQTISGEIKLDKLLKNLMNILIQNAGADRGVLLLKDKNNWFVEAEESEEKEVKILQHIPLEETERLPQTVIQYAIRTNEPLVLNNPAEGEQFGQDIYIGHYLPKSVLCLPVNNRGQLMALLYLENQLSSHVFNKGRLETLKLLSGQAAVSINNSMLYENLEEKVLERTHEIENQKIEIEQQKEELEKEKVRSEELLHNILPAETAHELKRTGGASAKHFEEVTVMFVDIQNFTQHAQNTTAEKLVGELHHVFKSYDEIVSSLGIEKIKTIGDAYMCACGIPTPKTDNALVTIRAAQRIMDFMKTYQTERQAANEPFFQVRIGIHTGSVIAGIVGVKKFAYDIWGHTVNLAARMEDNGEVGKINISEATYELVKDHFDCTFRGKIEVKNLGEVGMYFVEK